MSDIECPYCEHMNKHDYEQSSDSHAHEMECRECEKSFVFTVEYCPRFRSRKADCLNGGEHDWKDLMEENDYYRQFFTMRRKCRDCEKREQIKKKDGGIEL